MEHAWCMDNKNHYIYTCSNIKSLELAFYDCVNVKHQQDGPFSLQMLLSYSIHGLLRLVDSWDVDENDCEQGACMYSFELFPYDDWSDW